MADGKIRITLEARQAIQIAEQLTNQLNNVDKAAGGANQATDKLSASSKKAAESQKALVSSITAINNRVRQLATIGTASNNSLMQLNATVSRMAQSHRDTVAAIQNATTALTNMRAAQGAAAQGAAGTGDSIERMGRQMSATTTLANGLRGVLLTFGTALSMQYAVRTLVEFDHAMAQVEAISRATGNALTDLRERAKELGSTTIYTSGEAASAMKFLAQSGFDVNEILAASGPVLALAQAGDIGLAQAAEIAAKALRGFRLDATQMSDVADVMAAAVTQSTMNIQEMGYAFKYVAPIAASMGVNIREASAYIGVLSDAGIDATMAGTALRRIMSEISNPTIKATKLLAAHGLTMADVDIQAKGLTETIKTLVNAGLSVGEVFALFGDRGAPAFQTLSQQVDKVEQKIANLQNVTGRAAEMQNIMNQSLYAAYKNLTSAIEFFVIQLSEETGLLYNTKAALFGTAEGVRILARNMDIVAPIITALAVTKLPALILALDRFGLAAKAMTALKTPIDISASVDKVSLALRNMATQFAVTRASGTAASAAIITAWKGVSTVIKGAGTALWSLTNMLGGPLNAALMLAAGATMYFSMHQTEAEKAGELFKDLLEAQARGADAYAKEFERLKESVRSLDLQHATKKFEEAQTSMQGLQAEFRNTVDSAGSLYDTFKRLWNTDETGVTYEHTVDVVKSVAKAYDEGGISAEEMRRRLEQLLGTLGENDKGSRELVMSLLDITSKMGVASSASDVYAAKIALLTGKMDHLNDSTKAAAEELRKLSLLQQEQVSSMLEKTFGNEFLADVYARGQDMSKKEFDVWLRANKTVYEELGAEATRYYKVVQNASGQYTIALKTEQEMGKEAWEAFKSRKPLQESELTYANNLLASLSRLRKLQQERSDKDREESKNLSGKSGAANKYASAVSKVNEELARMFMTDREFQQFKFEQELAKLQKTLGATNPEFQKLVQLWQKAKELGMSSPKEIMKARTSFEDWLQVQEHGGDQNWTKKALIDEQAKYLEEFYRDDAQKAVKIKQWAEDEKRKITSGSLQKDTQSLLQFWDNYMSIAYTGEEQYEALLNQYYQERYQTYLALCNDEVAARRMAEYEKLKLSRKALDGFKLAIADWVIENTNMAKQMYTITTNFLDNLADAMTDMAMTGKASWEDLGRTVLRELEKMIIKSLILANLLKIMGMISDFALGSLGIGSGGDTSAAGEDLLRSESFQAKGGVFSGGNISDYSGSVVSAPTAFSYSKHMTAFARGGAVMGEAGSEGIFPLGRNSRGELGVKADLGGASSGRDVVVNIFNYSNEDVRQESSLDSNGNKTIDVWIGDTAADQMQKPGSNLNRAVRNVTGIKQQVTRR